MAPAAGPGASVVAAGGAPAPVVVEQTTELLQKLSINSQNKTADVPEYNPAKKNSSGDTKGFKQTVERSTTPVIQTYGDQNMAFMTDYSQQFYSPDLLQQSFDGMSVQTQFSGDNGSYYYMSPGYSPYSPTPSFGNDGQLYGPPQQYSYDTYYQTSPPNSSFTPTQAASVAKGEVSTSGTADKVSLPVEAGKVVNANGGANNSNSVFPLRPSNANSSLSSNGSYGRGSSSPNGLSQSVYHDSRYPYDAYQSPGGWFDPSLYNNGQNRPLTSSAMSSPAPYMNSGRNSNIRPLPHLINSRGSTGMGMSPAYMNNRFLNSRMYNQFGNMGRTPSGYASNGYDSRYNPRAWMSAGDNKFKPRGRGNGFFGFDNENSDVSELPRGPRARPGFKITKPLVPITLIVKGQTNIDNDNNSEDKEDSSSAPDKEQYNREDFAEEYSDAKCFIIKSYSEDDFHKSIKYGVWASTINGNKKLDAAYREAQEKTCGCPVFLFFSVNASGQFVGLAEMVGPVDFDKTVEYWQQDKWNGHFPVKWHIVKDVPNNSLKHITLENNDNKPVTNSRDTQEVKFVQGLQMLKIFKGYTSKTCILDDFAFYEDRQKTMVEKKAKQQQTPKQVWDGKPTKVNVELDGQVVQKSLEAAAMVLKDAKATVHANGIMKLSNENDLVGEARDAQKVDKPVVVTENKVLINGVPDVAVANGVVTNGH